MVGRFDVFLANLDPELSKDAKNTRPCVVISPDEMNNNVGYVIIAPISGGRNHPTRVPITFLNNERVIVLDQLRTIDKARLVKKIGQVEKAIQNEIIDRLLELFAE